MVAGRAHTTIGSARITGNRHVPNKSLGQHWLKDRLVLEAIADCAQLTSEDMVLEIGPGLGTLTSVLLSQAKQVVAVEFDPELARKLPGQFPGKNLSVEHADILSYDLTKLPADYKVVANVPYYITSKIVQALSESPNPPSLAVLLVQREVAERIAAQPGDMSILAIAAQVYAYAELGPLVPAEYFTPPPKVDSQVVVLRRRESPQFGDNDPKDFFRMVKAGFSAKRKKLRSSLSGGLGISKSEVEALLSSSKVSPDARAEDLGLEDWQRLTHEFATL